MSPARTRRITLDPSRRAATISAVRRSAERCTCSRARGSRPDLRMLARKRSTAAVIQRVRRLARVEADIDVDRVALVRADPIAVVGDRIASLVARRDDLLELLARHDLAHSPRDPRRPRRRAPIRPRRATMPSAAGSWRRARASVLLMRTARALSIAHETTSKSAPSSPRSGSSARSRFRRPRGA